VNLGCNGIEPEVSATRRGVESLRATLFSTDHSDEFRAAALLLARAGLGGGRNFETSGTLRHGGGSQLEIADILKTLESP
jgi:hypothetical protein